MQPLVLGKRTSNWIKRYYLGFDHPFKLRLLRNLFKFFNLRLTVPYEKKQWITLNIMDGVEAGLLSGRYYEPEVWETLKSFIQKEEVFWDVGANIGAISLLAVNTDGIKEVHSFEPNPKVFSILKKHQALNQASKLSLHAYALGEKAEIKKLYLGPLSNSGKASLIKENATSHEVSIECKTIDQVLEKGLPPPTLMKIDTEGWELPALKGGERLFKTRPPKAIVFENEYVEGGKDFLSPEIRNLLLNFGYQIKLLVRPYGRRERFENFLAFRK